MRKNMLFASAARGALGGMTPAERRLGRYMRDGEGHPDRTKTAEQLADDLRKAIDKKHDEVMKKADDALTEAKKAGGLSEETKKSVDEMLLGVNTLREQLTQVEQKMARKPGADGDQVKSFGAQVTESDRYKSYVGEGARGNFRIELKMPNDGQKAITAAQAGTAWSERDLEVTSLPRRTLTVRSLLNVVPTTSASIDYAQQTTRTNNAAVVAEAASEADQRLCLAQLNVVGAHDRAPRQAHPSGDRRCRSAAGRDRQRNALRPGARRRAELLSGDGTGQHLTGLIPNATAYRTRRSSIPDLTMIDVCGSRCCRPSWRSTRATASC
jgi:hypothetical protein